MVALECLLLLPSAVFALVGVPAALVALAVTEFDGSGGGSVMVAAAVTIDVAEAKEVTAVKKETETLPIHHQNSR